MSDEKDKSKQAVVPYEVGYGKPPVQHRFRKGQSGNPKGRPRGSKNRKSIDMAFGARPTQELLKQEAYRTVAIREGDTIIELPAIQAVFRSMGVSAMKGNRFAQRTLAELVEKVEAEDRQARLDYFEAFFDYKNKWGEEIERCRKAGLPEPEPIPHPDDIRLDFDTGDVRLRGPITKEEKQRYDGLIERRSQSQEDVSYFADKYRRARNEDMKSSYLEEWHWEQRMFDLINDAMPGRYKVKLEDRSYREGASREGKTLEEFRNNRKMQKEYIG